MPRHLRTGRLAILCMLVIGCMVVAAAPAGATPATGHSRVPVKIEMLALLHRTRYERGHVHVKDRPDQGHGTYTETFTIVDGVIDAVKVLTGRRGTIVMRVHGFVDNPTPTTVAFRGGRWGDSSPARARTAAWRVADGPAPLAVPISLLVPSRSATGAGLASADRSG